ncbi:MAG: LytR/AlgR family response regulator transcription factor [Dorea formicigenerans]
MLHISICDDERIAVEKMQRIVENVLEQEHLLVKLETFENGEEFLQQYVIRDDELVILDLDMPVKNGIDVIQELEKIQRNEVVILVTAYDNLALKTFSYGLISDCQKRADGRGFAEGDRQISEYAKKKSRGIGISDKGRTDSCETGGYCIF